MMGSRIAVASMLGALQAVLLAGCAQFSASNDSAGSPVYAMAAPQPMAEPQPEEPPVAPPPMQNATPPQGKFGVQVAAPSSAEEARALIDNMRVKYPELAQQWAAILPVTLPAGTFYRVVIGPLPTEAQASQLCGRLKAQGAACFIRRT
jgi:cell division septation protein DedD